MDSPLARGNSRARNQIQYGCFGHLIYHGALLVPGVFEFEVIYRALALGAFEHNE